MKHNQYCAALNCPSARRKCKGLSGLSFFRFPKDEERSKEWVFNAGRKSLSKKTAAELYNSCVLCANHFEDGQFMNASEKNKLVWNAIPTIFSLPNPPKPGTWAKGQKMYVEREELQTENTSKVSDDINCRSDQDITRSGSSDELDQNNDKKTKVEKKFLCDMCGKSYTRKWHLRNHMLTHTGEKEFKCDVCDKQFSLKLDFNRHVALHSGIKNYVCNVCEQRFARKAHMDRHMNIHTLEKKFSCSICEKKFSRKYCLQVHMLIHTGEKKFVCEECGKSFHQKSQMTFHINVHHFGEKKFKCEECEKSFHQKSQMTRHIDVHHFVEKRYKCDHCAEYFARKTHLTVHLKGCTHNPVKKHKCVFCGKLFYRKSRLMRHLAMHTRLNALSCEICGQTFTQRPNLNKHLKVHARIEHALSSLREGTKDAESKQLGEKGPKWPLETIFIVGSENPATSSKAAGDCTDTEPTLQGKLDTNTIKLEQVGSGSALQELVKPTIFLPVPDGTTLKAITESDTEMKQEVKEESIDEYYDNFS